MGKNHTGINDLKTWCIKNNKEKILQQWDYEANGYGPENIAHASPKQVCWHCPVCGHKWKTSLQSRVYKNGNCPHCSDLDFRKDARKPVINLDTGVIYESAKIASKATGIGQASIRNNCGGFSHSGGGYHWKYVEK